MYNKEIIYIMIIYGEKRLHRRRKKMVVMIDGFQFNKWHKTSYKQNFVSKEKKNIFMKKIQSIYIFSPELF